MRESPDRIEALLDEAAGQAGRGDLASAALTYERVLALWPGSGMAAAALGSVRQRQGRREEARDAYESALRSGYDDAAVRVNLGVIAREEGDRDAALAHFEAALRHEPGSAAASVNAGLVLSESGRRAESLGHFAAAIEAGGFDAEARWNRAIALLALGEYDAGWRDYESRWDTEQMRAVRRSFAVPQWRGEPLRGRTIHLWHEQGLGDTLQFCRYASRVAERGARVVLEVPKVLARLCAGLAGVERVISDPEQAGVVDLHCPLMSLPLAFGTSLADIPADVPYLRADDRLRASWAARLGPVRRPRIGLVWSSRIRRDHPIHLQVDIARSIPLAALAPLGSLEAQLVCLQIGDGREQMSAAPAALAMLDATGDCTDFADTAALVANLDAVVSVDTAGAHLGGALGVPTYVLLDAVPSWRWLEGRADTPWYPTMRLFRQARPNDWREPVAQLHATLASRFETGRAEGLLTRWWQRIAQGRTSS